MAPGIGSDEVENPPQDQLPEYDDFVKSLSQFAQERG